MPRKSHRRRRKKVTVPARSGGPASLTWRGLVKCGPAWYIAYEGQDERWVEEVKRKYRSKKVTVERI